LPVRRIVRNGVARGDGRSVELSSAESGDSSRSKAYGGRRCREEIDSMKRLLLVAVLLVGCAQHHNQDIAFFEAQHPQLICHDGEKLGAPILYSSRGSLIWCEPKAAPTPAPFAYDSNARILAVPMTQDGVLKSPCDWHIESIAVFVHGKGWRYAGQCASKVIVIPLGSMPAQQQTCNGTTVTSLDYLIPDSSCGPKP
jgi:hypothetical protein